MVPNNNLLFTSKDKYHWDRCSKEQKEKIKYLYTTATINGYVLPNLVTSYRSKKLYLGKG